MANDIGVQMVQDLANMDPLAREEELELARDDSPEAKWKLVLANMRYIRSRAKRYVGNRHQMQDLLSAAYTGAMDGAVRFDDRGCKFITKATRRIDNALQQEVARTGFPVKIASIQGRVVDRVLEEKNRVSSVFGLESPNDPQQIAAACGIRAGHARQILIATAPHISMDAEREDSDDWIAGRLGTYTVEDTAEMVANREFLERVLGLLTKREKMVLQRRHGLYDDNMDSMTLQEIANDMCLSRERVRQIEATALAKIRASEEFAEFIVLSNV